jgi:hypothetical protein
MRAVTSGSDSRGRLWRSRWAAIGAAVAVTFGAGGLVAVNAAGGVDSTTVLTDPVRVLDSRDPTNVGLAGPFASQVSQKLQITGSIPTTTGTKTVVPAGATGVLLNVTTVFSTANGFISIRPGDATGLPTTSSLNFNAGQVVPNAVLVALATSGANAGKIDITYDAYGASGPTTDILIDVVGYTNNSTLAALQAEIDAVEAVNAAQQTQINAKANAAEVYARGPVTMTHGPSEFTNATGNAATDLAFRGFGVEVSGDGTFGIGLVGPAVFGGETLTLTSATYCIDRLQGGAFITLVEVFGLSVGQQPLIFDSTDRTTAGCYTVTPDATVQSLDHFQLIFVANGGGTLNLLGLTTTWGPRPAALQTSQEPSNGAVSATE